VRGSFGSKDRPVWETAGFFFSTAGSAGILPARVRRRKTHISKPSAAPAPMRRRCCICYRQHSAIEIPVQFVVSIKLRATLVLAAVIVAANEAEAALSERDDAVFADLRLESAKECDISRVGGL